MPNLKNEIADIIENKTHDTCLQSHCYPVKIPFPREKSHWLLFYYISTLDILWTSSNGNWRFNLNNLFSLWKETDRKKQNEREKWVGREKRDSSVSRVTISVGRHLCLSFGMKILSYYFNANLLTFIYLVIFLLIWNIFNQILHLLFL